MVYLTGAGCGDKELITLKAKKAIENADVLIYDALIDKSLLELAPETCEKIYVGKRSNHHTLRQTEINELLVEYGDKNVVRLKGGDPYLFGRGAEEAEFLEKHGVDFEVIPGIPSAIGGLAYAGIPVTHRDYASGVAVLTGHRKNEADEYDYKALAGFAETCGTLIFLMGTKNIDYILKRLVENGLSPEMPTAAVSMASTPRQETVVSTVGEGFDQKIKAPAIIVIGEVVNLREKLNFFENVSPLYAKNVLVTRSRAQISSLSAELEERDAIPVEFPTIKIEENPEGIERLKRAIEDFDYTHVIFTSANAVEIFFKHLFESGRDTRALGEVRVAAIGTGTKRALEKYGVLADILPESFIAESLVETLKDEIKSGDKILLPRSGEARAYLKETLESVADLEEIPLYRAESDLRDYERVKKLLDRGEIDALTFTSSSTVKNFHKAFVPDDVEEIDIFSIGPQTSQSLRELGYEVSAEAKEYSIKGLIDCMEAYYDFTD